MKNKLFLAITAITLATVLVIGGTLMLFTTKTDTAKNVVTMGNIDAVLIEDGKIVGEINGDDDFAFTGMILGTEATPGDVLGKDPSVGNVGNVDAYVKMQGVLTFSLPSSIATMNQNELKDLVKPDGYYFKTVFPEINAAWTLDKDNYTVAKADGTNKYTVTYNWYYAKNDKLTVLPCGLNSSEANPASTAPVFSYIVLPPELGNDFEGFTFNLDMTAFLIQSNNIDGTGSANWPNMFNF